ncbi:hypothetical protein KP509_1Z295000 [Ceratopteris richardii]|nr:hypothetical protein KP509_1Z295000 [Ceratopteris richardii]
MENAERGIQERLKSHRLSASVVSPYTISAKGQQVSIKFPVSPLCDLWYLVVDLVANIGKLEDNTSGGKIVVSASSSLVAQVMTLEHPNYKIQQYMAGEGGQDISSNALCIDIFEPMMGEKFPEIEFLKKGAYSDKELDFIINALRIASVETPKTGPRANYKKQHEVKKKGGNKSKALESLEAMGVKVYGQDNISGQIDQDVVSWDNIAGYHEQKSFQVRLQGYIKRASRPHYAINSKLLKLKSSRMKS